MKRTTPNPAPNPISPPPSPIFSARVPTPVGEAVLASDGERLVGLWLTGQKRFMRTLSEPPIERPDAPIFDVVRDLLARYFAGERPDFSPIPLAPFGNAFQRTVWGLLREIPFGEIATYGELASAAAARLGVARMSAQAIGGAVGRNPIAIVVPCHRVVGAGGALTGFAAGLDVKEFLLRLEGVDLTRRFPPKSPRRPKKEPRSARNAATENVEPNAARLDLLREINAFTRN